jgi:hypothetical protein
VLAGDRQLCHMAAVAPMADGTFVQAESTGWSCRAESAVPTGDLR